jgi:hypothetical protein
MPNYAFTRLQNLPIVENNSIIDGWNLTQKEPNTSIFIGNTGLTFIRCNLINCSVPIGSIIEDCLVGNISFCSNEHPEWVAKGLTECVENCSHVTSVDTITIDGVVVDTIYHYSDKVV